MTGNTKMAEQLKETRAGREAQLYTTALDCIRQCKTTMQASKLLAKKFIDANPWACDLFGTAAIERQCSDYIRKRYAEINSGKKDSGLSTSSRQLSQGLADDARISPSWKKIDMWPAEESGPVHVKSHVRSFPSAAGGTASLDMFGHNSGDKAKKTAFDASRMRNASAAVKTDIAETILDKLKFSDGRLAAQVPLRDLRCYRNDGVLSDCLLKKIEGKYANPDGGKTIADYLSIEEIEQCVEEAKRLKVAA